MQAASNAVAPAEDEAGSPAYWLCRHCGSPQSQALPICLECGDRRVAAVGMQHRPRAWFFVGLAVVAMAWGVSALASMG